MGEIAGFGGLDIGFNNAGAFGEMAVTSELTRQAWTAMLETNLTVAFLGAKHQIPAMQARGGGSIIFASSFVGHTVGFPDMAAYAANKAALVGLAKALAVELGLGGIRVNALLPGGTDTPMGRQVADMAEARAALGVCMRSSAWLRRGRSRTRPSILHRTPPRS